MRELIVQVKGFLLSVFVHINFFYEQDLVVTFLVSLFHVVLYASMLTL